jgi:hypothetical protein
VLLLSPKSCANLWSESGDRGLDLGELSRGLLFIPSCPGLTSLTGARDTSGELPGSCVFVLRCCCLVLGRFRGVWLRFVKGFIS